MTDVHLPAGNLRRANTWDEFFDTPPKARSHARPTPPPSFDKPLMPPLSPTSSTTPHKAGRRRGSNNSRRSGSVSHPTKKGFHSTLSSADFLARLAAPSSPPPPEEMRPGTAPAYPFHDLKPSAARTRRVYDGPPGPGTYGTPSLPTTKTLSATFGGKLAGVDRQKTGPFGRTKATPGPGQYTPRGATVVERSKSTFSACTTTMPRADRKPRNMRDPLMKPQPRSHSPGPAAYSSLLVPPTSTQRTAPAFTMRPNDRDTVGIFGRMEQRKAGVDVPGAVYDLPSPFFALPGGVGTKAVPMASVKATMGGTAPRSDPACWDQDPRKAPKVSRPASPTGPAGFDLGMGLADRQQTSQRKSPVSVLLPREQRDSRYHYIQPDFKDIVSNTATPGPGNYALGPMVVPTSPGMLSGPKFGLSGRSPVSRSFA